MRAQQLHQLSEIVDEFRDTSSRNVLRNVLQKSNSHVSLNAAVIQQ